MRKTLIIDLMLGFALNFFESQENDEAAEYVKRVTALKQAGGEVDDHMRAVADYLLSGKPLDLESLADRVDSEVDELLDRGEGFDGGDDGGQAPNPDGGSSGGGSDDGGDPPTQPK